MASPSKILGPPTLVNLLDAWGIQDWLATEWEIADAYRFPGESREIRSTSTDVLG